MTIWPVRKFWDLLLVANTCSTNDPSFIVGNCQVRFLVLIFDHSVTTYSALDVTHVEILLWRTLTTNSLACRVWHVLQLFLTLDARSSPRRAGNTPSKAFKYESMDLWIWYLRYYLGPNQINETFTANISKPRTWWCPMARWVTALLVSSPTRK